MEPDSFESRSEAWDAATALLSRLSIAYLLDVIDIERGEGTVLDPMVVAVVSAASVAPIVQDPALQQVYADLDSPPPDSLRRPITINAVAASLGLPFESVRRTVHRLSAAGELTLTPRGVMQSAAVASSPRHLQRSLAHFERTRRLYDDLLRTGFAPLTADAQTQPPDRAPIRIVNRLRSEYALRAIGRTMAWLGNPLRALILMTVVRAHQEQTPADLDSRAQRGAPPTISLGQVAQRTNLSRETTRRHLAALADAAFLQRTAEGVQLAPKLQGDGGGPLSGRGAASDLRRFVEQLEAFGVAAWWRAENGAAAAGAA